MRREYDGGAVLECVANRGKRSADPLVAGNLLAAWLQWHVKIDADENTLAGQIQMLNRNFRHRALLFELNSSGLNQFRAQTRNSVRFEERAGGRAVQRRLASITGFHFDQKPKTSK